MAAHQAPQSLEFSRQEYWSGLLFSSLMHESEKWKWTCSVVSYPQRPHGLQPSRLLRPWDFPGKSTGEGCHCLLRFKWWDVSKLSYDCEQALLLLLLSHVSHVRLCATPQMAAHQTPLSLGFSSQEHWSGLPLPSLEQVLDIIIYQEFIKRHFICWLLQCSWCNVYCYG